MKTPDKIYLPGDIDWPSAAILTLGNQPGDVEYIRKEALLEWAIETKVELEKQNVIKDDIRKGAVWELEEVIEKIESL